MLSATTIGKFLGGDLVSLWNTDGYNRSPLQETIVQLLIQDSIDESERRILNLRVANKNDVSSNPDLIIDRGTNKIPVVVVLPHENYGDYGLYVTSMVHCHVQRSPYAIVITQRKDLSPVVTEYRYNKLVATEAISLVVSVEEAIEDKVAITSLIELGGATLDSVIEFQRKLCGIEESIELPESLLTPLFALQSTIGSLSMLIDEYERAKALLVAHMHPYNKGTIGDVEITIEDGDIEAKQIYINQIIPTEMLEKNKVKSREWLKFQKYISNIKNDIKSIRKAGD